MLYQQEEKIPQFLQNSLAAPEMYHSLQTMYDDPGQTRMTIQNPLCVETWVQSSQWKAW